MSQVRLVVFLQHQKFCVSSELNKKFGGNMTSTYGAVIRSADIHKYVAPRSALHLTLW
jgi:hypothetical protein